MGQADSERGLKSRYNIISWAGALALGLDKESGARVLVIFDPAGLGELSARPELAEKLLLPIDEGQDEEGATYMVVPLAGGELLKERLGRGSLCAQEVLEVLSAVPIALSALEPRETQDEVENAIFFGQQPRVIPALGKAPLDALGTALFVGLFGFAPKKPSKPRQIDPELTDLLLELAEGKLKDPAEVQSRARALLDRHRAHRHKFIRPKPVYETIFPRVEEPVVDVSAVAYMMILGDQDEEEDERSFDEETPVAPPKVAPAQRETPPSAVNTTFVMAAGAGVLIALMIWLLLTS